MSSFFSKCSKFDEYFKNGEKNRENVFSFLDNCILSSTWRFQVEEREYFRSAVNKG